MEWIGKYWVEVAFGAIVALLGAGYRHLAKKVKEGRAKDKAVEEGLKALLRDRVVQAHNHYIDKGYCPIHEKENVQDLFKAYTGLEGNGTVPGLVDTIMKLPSKIGEK